jgi:prepilin-type N-terminal cleavage/methylation domain-containing protein
MARRRRVAGRIALEQRGFTMIELLVVASLVAIGLVSLISTFDHSRDLTNLNEQLQTANYQAERELERLLASSYSTLALQAAPAHSTDPKDPDYYVSSGSPPTYQWDQGSTGPQSSELVIDASNGSITTSKVAWSDSDSRLSGYVHRYVTWTGDLCASCAGTQRGKRITVAVTVDGPDAPRKPVLMSTIKTDPTASG